MFDGTDRTWTARAPLAAAATVLAGAFLVLAQPASAQQGQQSPPPTQEIEVPDGELETFAEAHLEVQEIREEMDREIQNAEDTESAQAVQQEANREMATLIEDEHEMEVERYTQIAQAINQDPELQQRFQAVVDELTEDEEGGGSDG